MNELSKENLFSIEEAAKICGLSRDAMYMRYRRGQIKPERLLCHRIYFTRSQIDEFRSNYMPYYGE